MSFYDAHEIEQYNLAISAGNHAPQSRTIWLKLKGLYHGLEPGVFLIFGLPNQQGFRGYIDVKDIWLANFFLLMDESAFGDIYAVLRSEKPVFFHYTSAENWTDPKFLNKKVDILGFSIGATEEPVGEVETKSVRMLNLKSGIEYLQKKSK